MRISLDVSLYPLHEAYKAPILDFIERLRGHEGIEVRTNALSTQVFGEHAIVWDLVGQELERCFGESFNSVAVIKVVGVDVSG